MPRRSMPYFLDASFGWVPAKRTLNNSLVLLFKLYHASRKAASGSGFTLEKSGLIDPPELVQVILPWFQCAVFCTTIFFKREMQSIFEDVSIGSTLCFYTFLIPAEFKYVVKRRISFILEQMQSKRYF